MAPLTRGLELLGWAISYALASTRLATPQRLPCPTPCADWDLGLLLRHVSDSVGVLHEAITTGCIGSGPAADDDEPDPDVVSGLYRRAGRLLAACAPAAPAAPAGHLVTIGDQELPAKMAVAAGAIEITVHGWDISVACGSRRPVPPDLAALLLPIAPLFIAPGSRAGLFADPVPVPGRACPGDQLVAFLGRQPHCPAVPSHF
jgi:uncharacterized protein (TIGR03086 family)